MDLNHEQRLTQCEERSKSNTHRIDRVEKRQDELMVLAQSVKTIAEREEHLEEHVNEIKSDVKELKNKPIEKWEKITNTALTALVGAIMGYILSHIGF